MMVLKKFRRMVTAVAFCSALLGLGQAVHAQQAEKLIPVLIQFGGRPGEAEIASVNKHRGVVTRQFQIVPAVAAKIPAVALEAIANEPGVVAVEPDGLMFADDAELDGTWGVKRIGCGPVHTGTFPATSPVPVLGTGVRVAVLDTGIDYLHSELFPNYAGGYDFINNDSNPIDDQYHGTHVAGTIAAADDNLGVVGAAPGASLYAVKVLGSNGSGSYSAIIAGLDWCVQNGIHVANLSLGSSGDPGSTVKAAFDNAYAAGLVIVASAGNSGAGTDTVGYPAKYASVIAVASTTSSDGRSSFSSTGPAVEIAAPGSSIYSTYPGGGYAYLSGTSMAAPHVAGVAALILSAGIADQNGDGRRNDDVRGMLQFTADDLGVAGVDNEFGYGLVDALSAVSLAYDPDYNGGQPPAVIFNAPSNLAGSVNTSKQVVLTWLDNSNCESGFELQRGIKAKGGTTWSNLATTAADTPSYTTAVQTDGTYQFRVRATRTVNGVTSYTGWSNQIQVTVGATKGRK